MMTAVSAAGKVSPLKMAEASPAWNVAFAMLFAAAFCRAKTMLLSGLLDKAAPIAERAIVVNAHLGSGHVLLFANNPVYRGETVGSYPLVFNALMNFEHLSAAAEEQK